MVLVRLAVILSPWAFIWWMTRLRDKARERWVIKQAWFAALGGYEPPAPPNDSSGLPRPEPGPSC